MTYVLTDKLLEDYLQCASKSYLRLQGQPGEIHDFAALCSRLEARHRASAIEQLAASQTTTNDVRNFGGSPVQDALAGGYQLILDAVGAANGLETHFDGLERCLGKSHLGTYCYRPIRSCRYQKPSSAFYLLLAFDALILRDLQGTLPSDGILICGPSFKRTHVSLRKYLDSLPAILSRLRLQSASAPPLALNRHCELCEFRRTCHGKAVKTDNLTLLRGMTPKEVARYNSKGIFTVTQLSYTFRLRRPAKRQRPRFQHSFALQALALRQHAVHVHGDPQLVLPPIQVYLDIEGIPEQSFYYLIGVLVVTSQSQQYHCFWSDDGGDQMAIFVQLAELLTSLPNCKVFHYGSYDLNAIRKMLPRLPERYRESLNTTMLDSTNVLSLISFPPGFAGPAAHETLAMLCPHRRHRGRLSAWCN